MISWLSELWRFRELLLALSEREIKIRYKQTLLGASWAILQPASLTIIFTIVFEIFLKISSQDVPYPIFVYSALVPWTFFSNSLSFGSLSVVNNGNLVTKVYFPREILPLSSIAAVFFDFLMASVVFAFLMILYKIPLSINIVYLLILVPDLIFLTCGLSFIFSTINVLWRDVKFVIPLLLQVWLFITPIIYSISQVPDKYQIIFKINPLSPLLQGVRDVTIYSKSPSPNDICLSLFMSAFIFVAGYWFFKSKEKIFADVM